MCGITGIITFSEERRNWIDSIEKATLCLKHRGPDVQQTWCSSQVALGHCRLSIIDLSEAGNQPLFTQDKRYAIIYNGEIYNYKELRIELEKKGVYFQSQSDTEVLLYGYQIWGKEILNRLNGFFAFAIYDKEKHSLFLARDRFGIKPLYWSAGDNFFAFASELSALLEFPIPRQLDPIALLAYFQLTYIPAPLTILKGVFKLPPGHYLEILEPAQIEPQPYYSLLKRIDRKKWSYEAAQQHLVSLMEESVHRRLIADVPIGTYLSGGIDSSIITALAARESPHIQAFTVSFPEYPFYNERFYAECVAKRYPITHQVLELREKDLLDSLPAILDHFDEPFGDSSAVAVYHISRIARESVKVILSGDGADEVFGGYLKHWAEYYAEHYRFLLPFLLAVNWMLRGFPQHRGGWLPNKIRQLRRWVEGARLPYKERYWYWARFVPFEQVCSLFEAEWVIQPLLMEWELWKEQWISPLNAPYSLNDEMNGILLNDVEFVLPNDMLKKVDLMSMAHGLEIRVPFLDHEVVEFAFSLPSEYKISRKMRKRLLQDAFRSFLPHELYGRPKRGFEIPLKEWLQGPLKEQIETEWLTPTLIKQQRIFKLEAIEQIKKSLFSSTPGDTPTLVWCLIVFQYWWLRYFG